MAPPLYNNSAWPREPEPPLSLLLSTPYSGTFSGFQQLEFEGSSEPCPGQGGQELPSAQCQLRRKPQKSVFSEALMHPFHPLPEKPSPH